MIQKREFCRTPFGKNYYLCVVKLLNIVTMKLTEEQLKDFSQKLKAKNECPVCGAIGKFSIDANIYTIPSFEKIENSLNIGGPITTMPAGAIICTNCSYTRFFNLKILGVVEQ